MSNPEFRSAETGPYEPFREEVRKRHKLNPYRLGHAIGSVGKEFRPPYKPGSRGYDLYQQGLWWGLRDFRNRKP